MYSSPPSFPAPSACAIASPRLGPSRRRAVLLLLAAAPLFPATAARAQIPQGDITIELEQVAAGLSAPVYLTHAGDGSGRLFVVDQAGVIRIVQGCELLAEPFLDLTGDMIESNTFFDERGVLGLAFHPNYAENGRFFVRYSRTRTAGPLAPCNDNPFWGCHEEVLAEFTVSDDPNIANPEGAILFRVNKPEFNHNAGQVVFGPDGYLHFSFGDGGGAHDGLAEVELPHGPNGNGQNFNTPLGAILRIDVDAGPPYGIPADNPFVGVDGLNEVYAYGLRNPYRFSFDDGPGGDGRLILADVGQNLFEEINIIENGGNYGWAIREGLHCFDPFNPTEPPEDCSTDGLTDPVAEYTHDDGLAVVGGFVYRGSNFPALVGKYVFGDFSTDFFVPGGRLFYLDADGDMSQIFEFIIGEANEPLGAFLLGIGEDEAGEIYVLTNDQLAPVDEDGSFSDGGRVLRVTAGFADCNTDAVPDACDIANGTSEDCNTNVVPDECDGDANSNGIPDDCEEGDGCQSCPGDVNGDDLADASDIQDFVEALFSGEASPCGDMNQSGGPLDAADLALFSTKLLTEPTNCPP